ncbi:MAG: hypothetical protein M5U12_36340 [Verrucomicrobia bacterium]|nr:hypothetical protein [Verrucomicrobiota bacterium]
MKDKVQQTFDRFAGYKKHILAAAGLLVLTLLALALPAPQAQADRADHGNPLTLAGSWRIEVTDSPGSTFLSYETFTEAGGLVEINERGGPQPSIGAWKRIGPREFLATFYKPISKAASQGPFPFEPDFTVKARRLRTRERIT